MKDEQLVFVFYKEMKKIEKRKTSRVVREGERNWFVECEKENQLPLDFMKEIYYEQAIKEKERAKRSELDW